MNKQKITQNFRTAFVFIGLVVSLLSSGCSRFLPTSGPSKSAIVNAPNDPKNAYIQVVDVTDKVARKLLSKNSYSLFSDTLTLPQDTSFKVGPGDVLEVSVWEAPPATLFGGSISDMRSGSAATSRVVALPEQMISSEGTISIPFVGAVKASGRTLQQIEAKIEAGLRGKANQPQVLVRMIRNATSNVTLVGDVGTSTRMPLTPKGERLLDALAAAGGVKQPINKISLQITRGDKVYALPLDIIIRDPRQNVFLQPGDVVTALYQPLSFTALGATGKNEEINFEASGISLAQALARSGGLQDTRANAHGVFVFRFEDADAVEWPKSPVKLTPDKRVAVVYRLNLSDPASFLVAQNFPVNNRDVLYISNAPGAELQKFINLVTTGLYPAMNMFAITR